MKKVVRLLISLVLLLALAGCVKYDVTMGVNKDKSVDFEMVYAMDTSSYDNMGSEEETNDDTTEPEEDEEPIEEGSTGVTTDDYSFLEKKGYKVEEFYEEKDDKKYQGVKISKTFKSIDDITKEVDKTIDFNTIVGKVETFDESQVFSKNGKVYKASYLFDFSDDGKDVSADYKDYQSMFELTFTISLPNKPRSSNATKTSKDGKVLTWN